MVDALHSLLNIADVTNCLRVLAVRRNLELVFSVIYILQEQEQDQEHEK